jgi:hypothetical protein
LYRISRENHYDPEDIVHRRGRELFEVDRGSNSRNSSTFPTPSQVSEGVSTTPINDTRIPTPLREENVTTTVTNSSNAVGDTSTNDGKDVGDAVMNPRS